MAGFSLSISRNQQQGETGTLFLYGSGVGEITTTYATRGFELWEPAAASQGQEIELSLPQYGLGGSMRRGASGGGFSCQDCGNQAKKDCAHMRCRTCCKSRGLHCPTHVKSTWIPVAKRRERQQQRTAGVATAGMASSLRERDQLTDHGGGSGAGESSRRPREVTNYAHLPMAASGGRSGVSYPTEVNAQAAFRCVRVCAAADDAEEECAYQTAVSIGGHVFKGILYDHGPEADSAALASSPSADVMTVRTQPAATAPAAVSFLDAYPAPLNAFMAGTQLFPHHPRP